MQRESRSEFRLSAGTRLQSASDVPPLLAWRAAQVRGAELMAQQASKQGFKVERHNGLTHLSPNALYVYTAQTTRRFPHNRDVAIYFDGAQVLSLLSMIAWRTKRQHRDELANAHCT